MRTAAPKGVVAPAIISVAGGTVDTDRRETLANITEDSSRLVRAAGLLTCALLDVPVGDRQAEQIDEARRIVVDVHATLAHLHHDLSAKGGA